MMVHTLRTIKDTFSRHLALELDADPHSLNQDQTHCSIQKGWMTLSAFASYIWLWNLLLSKTMVWKFRIKTQGQRKTQ